MQGLQLQQLVLLIDEASSAFRRRQQKIVRRTVSSACPAGPLFFAAAVDGIRMPNAGDIAAAPLVACGTSKAACFAKTTPAMPVAC